MKNTKLNNNESNRFNIDFFEFSFLVEACIPPRPIARSMFWDKVCDNYYHILTLEERAKLLEWIRRNPNFDETNEDCAYFAARYSIENQYNVICDYNNKIEQIECFKFKERYHINKTTTIDEQFIKNINLIN